MRQLLRAVGYRDERAAVSDRDIQHSIGTELKRAAVMVRNVVDRLIRDEEHFDGTRLNSCEHRVAIQVDIEHVHPAVRRVVGIEDQTKKPAVRATTDARRKVKKRCRCGALLREPKNDARLQRDEKRLASVVSGNNLNRTVEPRGERLELDISYSSRRNQ